MLPGFSASPPGCTSAVEGEQRAKSQSPFPKNQKPAPTHPWGCSRDAPAPPRGPCEAGPETPQPPTGARLSRARGALWWLRRALRTPLGFPPCPGVLPSPREENRSP